MIPRSTASDQRRIPAFTAVELLIAIGILAVLAAVAFPVTNMVIARGKAADCINNLNNIGAALSLYLAQNNNRFPELAAGRMDKGDDVPTIDTVLAEYTDSLEIFHCKADDGNHFHTSGSSYFWNNTLNGQHVTKLNFMGIVEDPRGIPVVFDKENFHVSRGDEVNILYADGHIDKNIVLRAE